MEATPYPRSEASASWLSRVPASEPVARPLWTIAVACILRQAPILASIVPAETGRREWRGCTDSRTRDPCRNGCDLQRAELGPR